MTYEEEEEILNSLDYQGNRLNCGECLYCPKLRKDDVTKYTPCKMIDHDTIRFLPQIFNGYQGTIANQNICYFFQPAKWNISSQREWKGINDYIEFMDKFYYMTPSFLEYNKVKDVHYVTLVVGDGEYGDYQYEVSLYDWLTNNVFDNEGNIKYRKKIKIHKNKNEKPLRREVVDVKIN